MGVMTISMSDEDERMLRELAKAKFGKIKGAISKTISEITKEKTEKTRLKIVLKEMNEFFDLPCKGLGGKKPYESRNELYDRKSLT